MNLILLLFAIAVPALATSQTIRDSIKPDVGTPVIAAVGDTVYEKRHMTAIPAFVVNQSFSGKNLFAKVNINPGDRFIQIPSKVQVKACRSASVESFLKKQYDACLYDDDGDGTFDRFGGNEMQGGKRLPQPIPYKASEFVSPMSDSVKQTVIFLGSTKDSLRLSYREFVNDMARPAFTEEYTFPLSGAYPQSIGFKGVRLSVTAIDGEGVHYSVVSVPTTAAAN